jgi:hypothetical protein
MFGSIDNLRQQHTFYELKEKKLSEKNRLVSLLRSDFDRATSITLKTDADNRYTIASISGANHSLYGIFEPYVTWLVLKEQHRLIRIESPSPITLPILEEHLYQTHIDSAWSDCDRFRIYESAKHRLITFSFENESPVLIEVYR